MPNFLESMRLRNLFNPSPIGLDGTTSIPDTTGLDMSGVYGGGPPQDINFGPTNVPLNSISGMSDNYDAASRMRQLYQPSTDASSRFDKLISDYPKRENPSILRRLGSMIVDYTKGPQAGQAMMDQPFNESLTDWKNKVGPTEQAANLERYSNTNDRTLAYQQISTELRDRAQQAKEKNDEAKMTIAQHRADIYDFKAKNPDMKIVMPAGGNIQAINPQTGEIHDLGIPTGSLTETDKINLQQENKLKDIKATGEQNRQTENVRQTGREGIAETRGWSIFNIPDSANPGQTKAVKINAITGEVQDVKQGGTNVPGAAKPSSTGGTNKPEMPTQTRVRQFNAARQLINSRPELAQFIKLGTPGANDFTVTPPSTSKNYFTGKASGPTPQQFKEINDAIYGAVAPSHNTTNTAPPAPKGWKYVPKPGGGWTAIPDTGVK